MPLFLLLKHLEELPLLKAKSELERKEKTVRCWGWCTNWMVHNNDGSAKYKHNCVNLTKLNDWMEWHPAHSGRQWSVPTTTHTK